ALFSKLKVTPVVPLNCSFDVFSVQVKDQPISIPGRFRPIIGTNPTAYRPLGATTWAYARWAKSPSCQPSCALVVISPRPHPEVSSLKVLPSGPVTLASKSTCPTGMVTENPGRPPSTIRSGT